MPFSLVVFGLSVSSSWGNGHATLWRGLARALARRGHRTIFYERDVPYYAAHRDLRGLSGGELVLYAGWSDIRARAERDVAASDLALVTSYCPDAQPAAELVRRRARRPGFYDLDTPVTLGRLDRGEQIEYIPRHGLSDFDVVLSYTGGDALDRLRSHLAARCPEALYGSVDPDAYLPDPTVPPRTTLSYLGTFAADRHAALTELFLTPAARRRRLAFLLGGSMYPDSHLWPPNVTHLAHVAQRDHSRFYGQGRFTLNVTRGDMAQLGFCPSGRLFEAAACETAILSDTWPGLDTFFTPGRELLVVRDRDDVLAAFDLPDEQRRAIAQAARARVLRDHMADARAAQLERIMAESPGAHGAAAQA